MAVRFCPELQSMKKSEIIKYLILRSIGNFLVLFAIFGVLATFGPALYYEFQYRVIQARGVTFKVANVGQQERTPLGQLLDEQATMAGLVVPTPQVEAGLGSVLVGPKEQVLTPPDTSFSLVIPKIGATTKIAANVDPANEAEFLPVLQQEVAHAKGSVFPGIAGTTYLFAHSTDNFWDVGRYNAVFYLLKDLKPGDDIVVFFENRRHNYVVDKSVIVDPSDVSALTKAQEGGKEQLVLQTCWPPGTTWKRLLVFAKPK